MRFHQRARRWKNDGRSTNSSHAPCGRETLPRSFLDRERNRLVVDLLIVGTHVEEPVPVGLDGRTRNLTIPELAVLRPLIRELSRLVFHQHDEFPQLAYRPGTGIF